MRWVTPVLLASSLHVAAIGVAVRWHQAGGTLSSSATTASAGTGPATLATLRVVPRQPSPPMPAPEAMAEPQAAAQVDAESDRPSVTPAAAEPVPEAPQPPAPTSLEADASATTPAPDVYHPRSELNVSPRLQGMVDIAFPPDEPKHVRHEATLAVYIDEHGHVRKVEPVKGELPAAFAEAARNAFLSARFQPGEQGGQAVKSFIHVAVVFEEAPVEVASLSRALPAH